MPLLARSSFLPAAGLGNGHLQTVWPALFRKPPLVTTQRERLELADGDFLILDWARHPTPVRLAIITHGLESHSRDTTIQGMAGAFFASGWDVLAWNLRGCGGEPNRLARFYHSGASEDLAAVVDLTSRRYTEIALIGFSLGGNITLKYLGENPDAPVLGTATFSVPCDLTSSVIELDRPTNRVYTRRFIKSLRAKIAEKYPLFPNVLNITNLNSITTFHQFDSAYTAPLHGFASAEDYWEMSSCRSYLPRITVPALLVNAANDPFLGEACYPREIAEASPFFHLEIPESGGHCGFVSSTSDALAWHETRALEFLEMARAKRLPRD